MQNFRKLALCITVLLTIMSGLAEARTWFDVVVSQVTPNGKKDYRPGALTGEEALALYSPAQKRASFAACAEMFPAAQPIDPKRIPANLKPMALCSDSFAVLYSQTSKTPLAVVERLSANQLKNAKDQRRTDQFYADPRIPKEGRAELDDYRGQDPAVDRGHQAPAADAPTQRAMAQSFALSNMVPQDPTNNRKAWNKIETDVRKFVQRARGNVYVFTGPIFDKGFSTVGKNKVWKPTRLFKLVYDETSQRAWAYVLPNEETAVERPMDYASFVSETGLHWLDSLPVTGTVSR